MSNHSAANPDAQVDLARRGCETSSMTIRDGNAAGEAGWREAGRREAGWRGHRGALLLMGSALASTGCISVNSPDKPIVIELNINIKQEVIYRLAADAGKTIDTNKEIF